MSGHRNTSQVALRRGEQATWGTKPAAAPPAARLPKFTALAGEGATRAYLSVQPPSGIILNDVKLMRSPNGGYWIAMPSVKVIDREGNPLLNAKGRPVYRPIVEFKDRATRDRFCEMVLDLVRAEHPEALAADEGTP